MKNRFLTIKSLNLIIIFALIMVYQSVTVSRADQEAADLAAAQEKIRSQQMESGAAPVYNDGTYTGSGQGYGGTITLEVKIENDTITEINAVSHSGEGAAYWDMASSMIPEIVRTQNPNVDTISGATFTSTGIHNAVTEALKQALVQN